MPFGVLIGVPQQQCVYSDTAVLVCHKRFSPTRVNLPGAPVLSSRLRSMLRSIMKNIFIRLISLGLSYENPIHSWYYLDLGFFSHAGQVYGTTGRTLRYGCRARENKAAARGACASWLHMVARVALARPHARDYFLRHGVPNNNRGVKWSHD